MSLTSTLEDFDHGGYWHPSTDWLMFYCLIPKNASSWTSQVLAHNGWVRGQIEQCPRRTIDELIVILRDPVDRWVSGIAQYLSSYVLNSHWYDRTKYNQGYRGDYIPGKPNFLSPVMTGQQFISQYNNLTERLIFEQIAFDDHTQEQCWFVDYFECSNRTCFYFNESLQNNFIEKFKSIPLTVPADCDRNRGADNEDHRVISDFLHERIRSRPYLRNALERYYRRDYDMIESADFQQFYLDGE